jgi:hypothetical protein
MRERKVGKKVLAIGMLWLMVAVVFAALPMNVGAEDDDDEYVDVDLYIRVTGTKGTTAIMMMGEGGLGNKDCDGLSEGCVMGKCDQDCGSSSCQCYLKNVTGLSALRDPGPPDTDGVPARIYLSEDYDYRLEIIVEPNGKGGANPVTLDIVLPDGEVKSLHHTFNDQHGWSWVIPDHELKGMLSDYEPPAYVLP